MTSISFLKKAICASVAGLATLLSSCGGGSGAPNGSSASNGTVRVSMTDAPACGFDQVNVTVSKVRVHQSASADDSASGWHDIVLSPAKKINLLDLTNGVLQDLGQTTLPAGHYTQLRLVLSANESSTPLANSVIRTGTTDEIAIDTPSAIQSGIKLTHEFDVAADSTADLVLDFDACKSIVAKGNGSFSLKPVISVIPKITSGIISGYVAPDAEHVVVSAQKDGMVIKSTVPDPATGAFKLSPVPVTSSVNYVVVITADERATAAITGVPVTAGAATEISTASAPISLADSASHTISGVVTPLAISASVRATQALSAGGEKIEAGYQAADPNTGAYSLSLSAEAPQVGAFGDLPIVLTADTAIAGKYAVEAFADDYVSQTTDADIGISTTVTQDFLLIK